MCYRMRIVHRNKLPYEEIHQFMGIVHANCRFLVALGIAAYSLLRLGIIADQSGIFQLVQLRATPWISDMIMPDQIAIV